MRRGHALLLLFAATSAAAAPESADALRRDALRALRLPTPSERASALGRAFDGQDSPDAAQIAVEQVFGREDGQLVIDAAMAAVGRMHDAAVAGVLQKAADAGPELRRLRAIEALGRSSAAAAGAPLAALLVDPDAAIRAAAATALGRKGDAAAAADLETSLADPAWNVRSAAASALGDLRAKRSVPALCVAMRAADGRFVDDCAAALRGITGERFGLDPARYEAWWAKAEKKDPPTAPAWKPPPPSFDSPLFETRSRRLLFILSTSETMRDAVAGQTDDPDVVRRIREVGRDLADDLAAAKTKLDVARVHLRAMLRTLRDGVEFDVAAYSGSPSFAFGKLVPADAVSRRHAEARIASLSAGGPANLHGALVRAFDPRGKDPFAVVDGPDTIVLFSDGALAEPGSKDPTEVGVSAQRWNAVRQIRFFAIGVGQSDDAVLARLAAGPPQGATLGIP